MENKYVQIIILLATFSMFFLPVKKLDVEVIPQPRIAQVIKYAPQQPIIEARAGLAMDFVSEKILFEKNKNAIMPLASITKIISALVVLDIAEQDEYVEISRNAILTPEPSSLIVGEYLKVSDLLSMMMTESSNDAVTALVEHAANKNSVVQESINPWFLALMHKKAESLGVYGLTFYNHTGLDVSETLSGGYGSVSDILKVARRSIDSEIWQFGEIYKITSENGIIHNLKPTNALSGTLTKLVGAKTGFTDISGGNLLVIIEYPIAHPIGIVVLGSSAEARFEDVQKIINWIKSL